VDGKFRIGKGDWQDLQAFLPQVGERSAKVTCFKRQSVQATLLARWSQGYDEPWYILTDMIEEEAEVGWYGFRTWIESGYRDIKRDGWQWQYTRITEPKRAERIWLIMAIAMLWVLNEGGHAEEASSPRKEAPHEEDNDASQPVSKPFARIISCFLQGLNAILAKLLKGHDIVLRRFAPVQWYSVAPP